MNQPVRIVEVKIQKVKFGLFLTSFKVFKILVQYQRKMNKQFQELISIC